MDRRIDPTEAELLDALHRAMEAQSDGPDGAMTMRDLMDATRWSEKRLLRILRGLVASGDVRHVRVLRENICGVLAPVPAYHLTRPMESRAA